LATWSAAAPSCSRGCSSSPLPRRSTPDHALVSGFQLAFLIAAGCVAAGLAIALVVLRAAGAAPERVPAPAAVRS
jgi:hypothetical protein